MATFGNTATTADWTGTWSDYKAASRFTLSEDGTVSKLTLYCSNDTTGHAACNIVGLIYSDNPAGTPDALEGTTNIVPFANDAAVGWYDLTFATPVALTAGDYWLGILCDSTSAGLGIRGFTSGGDSRYNVDTYAPSGAASDPFGAGTDQAVIYCIYATYTPTATGTGHTSLIQFGVC